VSDRGDPHDPRILAGRIIRSDRPKATVAMGTHRRLIRASAAVDDGRSHVVLVPSPDVLVLEEVLGFCRFIYYLQG